MSDNWSEITASLENSGQVVPPTGLYGRSGYLVEDGNAAKVQTFDGNSDESALFLGDARLTQELTAYRLNAKAKANLIINSGPFTHLDGANLPSRIAEIRALGEVEMLVVDKDADAAFLTDLKNELASLAAQKVEIRALCRYRKALVLNLATLAAVDKTGGLVGIPAPGHPLAAGDTVILLGTLNYDGAYLLDATTSAGELVIPATFVAETFAAGASLEEKPESYLAAYSAEFGSFSYPRISLVAPTTQNGWLGAYAGAAANVETLAEEPGNVERHALLGVSIDEDWQLNKLAVIKGLAAGRAVVLKRHPEDPTNVYINLSPMLYGAQDDQKTLPLARIADKVLREVRLRAFPAINAHKFPRTDAGAMAIAALATGGFGAMKNAGELTKAEVTAKWVGAACQLTIAAEGPNHVSVVAESVTLTPAT